MGHECVHKNIAKAPRPSGTQYARTSSFTHSPHGPSEGTLSGRWHRRTWFARSAHPRCPEIREPPPSRENSAVRMLGRRRKMAAVAGHRPQVLSIHVRRASSYAGNVCTNGKTFSWRGVGQRPGRGMPSTAAREGCGNVKGMGSGNSSSLASTPCKFCGQSCIEQLSGARSFDNHRN